MVNPNACTMVLNHGHLIIPGPYAIPVAMIASQMELRTRMAAEGKKTGNDSGTGVKKIGVQTSIDESTRAKSMTLGEEIDAEFNSTKEKERRKTTLEVPSSADMDTTENDAAPIIMEVSSSADMDTTENDAAPIAAPIIVDAVSSENDDGKNVDFPNDDIMSVTSKHGDETSISKEHGGNHMGSKESKWFLRNKNDIGELRGDGEIRKVQENECTYNDDGVLWKLCEFEIRKRGVNIATRPIPFEGRPCLRVANAEDLVEANARTLLERIRAKDASAAKK